MMMISFLKFLEAIQSEKKTKALIDEIGDNQQIEMRWKSYCRNAMYAAHLSFKDVLISIREWIEIIL